MVWGAGVGVGRCDPREIQGIATFGIPFLLLVTTRPALPVLGILFYSSMLCFCCKIFSLVCIKFWSCNISLLSVVLFFFLDKNTFLRGILFMSTLSDNNGNH